MDVPDLGEAVAVLHRGGIIVYPTETVYGIGCDPLDIEACGRLQAFKKRRDAKTLLLLAATLDQVVTMVGELNEPALRLAEVFWPGPLTLVVKPVRELPPHLYGRSGGVAFRVSPHPVAAGLASAFGMPITSSSANMTGRRPVTTYEEAQALFGETVDVVLPDSETRRGRPSTVVDLTTEHPAIIREGSIALSRIREVL